LFRMQGRFIRADVWCCLIMDIFIKQKEYLDKLESDIFLEFEKTIRQFDFVLKDFIVNKQLFREGIDGNNKKLPGYKRTTIRLKISKGDPADRTTLKDSGDFYANIEIKAFSGHFEVSSGVEYDKFILKRYGKDVLRITDENFQLFVKNYFIPNFKSYVNNQFTK